MYKNLDLSTVFLYASSQVKFLTHITVLKKKG